MSTELETGTDLPSPVASEPPVVFDDFLWRHQPQAPRPPKFQHRYGRHILFFLLTVFTTSFTPAWMALWAGLNPLPLFTWPVFLNGLWYSMPVLAILSAHEFGHYFACRYHNVDATLPFFIPAPLPLTGTFGAVIRIREAFPSKRALFDIGVAGPLAGFITLLPFLYWGMTRSTLVRIPPGGGGSLYFGEPLLWKLFERMHFGVVPQGMDVMIDQVGFAAWWGMLATALNLLPFGQLDGGHIMYANVGRYAARLSAATLSVVLLLTFRSTSWVSMAVMMVAMAVFFGFRHPRIIDEHDPLDRPRRIVSVLALIIFIICFTPVPIDMGR